MQHASKPGDISDVGDADRHVHRGGRKSRGGCGLTGSGPGGNGFVSRIQKLIPIMLQQELMRVDDSGCRQSPAGKLIFGHFFGGDWFLGQWRSAKYL